MRVGIDASLAAAVGTGTGRYAFELIQNMLEIDHDTEYVLYFRRGCQTANPLFCIELANVVKRVVDAPSTNLRIQAGLAYRLVQDRVDVYHSPGYFLPLLWPGHKVVTIHDLNFIRFRSSWWWPGTRLSYLSLRLQSSLSARVASQVITVSENSKRDIVKVLRVPPEKVEVIYHGVPTCLSSLPLPEDICNLKQQYGHEPFYLCVGVISPQKNLQRLLEAYQELRRSTTSTVKLILVGRPAGLYYRNQLAGFVEASNLTGEVIFTDYVSNRMLRALYHEAVALVYPSLGEGFGLPVLEAMACGTPVIISHVSALPEVAGGAALYIDPYDVHAISHAMHRILVDLPLREDLVHKGKERAALFSWLKAAKQTLAVYEKVYQNGRPVTQV